MTDNNKIYSESDMKEIVKIASKQAIETAIEGLSEIAVTASAAAAKKAVQEALSYSQTEAEKLRKENTEKLGQQAIEQVTKEYRKLWNRDNKNKDKIEQELIDNRRFNVELLIVNYRQLKAHCEKIPEELEILSEFKEGLFSQTKFSLEKLMEEKAKTYNMMIYVDAMLVGYEKWAKSRGEVYERRYKILDRTWINKTQLGTEDLMELFNLSKTQIYRDRENAIKDFAPIMFGISVIDFK